MNRFGTDLKVILAYFAGLSREVFLELGLFEDFIESLGILEKIDNPAIILKETLTEKLVIRNELRFHFLKQYIHRNNGLSIHNEQILKIARSQLTIEEIVSFIDRTNDSNSDEKFRTANLIDLLTFLAENIELYNFGKSVQIEDIIPIEASISIDDMINTLVSVVIKLFQTLSRTVLIKEFYHDKFQLDILVPTNCRNTTLLEFLKKATHDCSAQDYCGHIFKEYYNFTEILFEYEFESDVCEHALKILSTYDHRKWAEEMQKIAVEHTFGGKVEHGKDDLLKQIKIMNNVDDKQLQILENIITDITKQVKDVTYTRNDIQQLQKKLQKRMEIQRRNILVENLCNRKNLIDNPLLPDFIAGIIEVVKLFFQFQPRYTQLLTLILMVIHPENTGVISEIKTGEGKSILIAMLAVFNASYCQKSVDIITFSEDLVIRDFDRFDSFYEMFSLKAGENTGISPDDISKFYKRRHIIYGTLSDFQRDYVVEARDNKHELHNRIKRGVVIIDEVDNMFIDERFTMMKLATELPSMTHLNLIYAAIWAHISLLNKRIVTNLKGKEDETYYVKVDFEIDDNGDLLSLEQVPEGEDLLEKIENKYTFFVQHTLKHMNSLTRVLTQDEVQEYETFNNLNHEMSRLENEILNEDNYKMRKEKSDSIITKVKNEELTEQEGETLINVLETEHPLSKTERKLKTLKDNDLPKEKWLLNDRYPFLTIPNHLRSYIKKQLPNWVDSALSAKTNIKLNKSYSIVNEKIIPIDYTNTGEFQYTRNFEHGLNQYLEIEFAIANANVRVFECFWRVNE